MSESTNDNLDSLNLKDLKRLAGEHKLPNRSRLGKSDLLSALKGVLQSAAEAKAPEAPVSEAPKPSKKPAKKAAKVKETPKTDSAADEPEVLDPAALAGLAEAPSEEAPKKGRKKASAKKASETPPSAESPAEKDEPKSDEPTPEQPSAEQSDTPSEGEEGNGERRKRRRRRRRRRRGDGEESESAEANGDTNTDKGDAESSAAVDTAETAETESKPAKSAAEPAQEVPAAKTDKPKSKPEARPEARRRRGPAKPRLQGDQRRIPSILNRLKDLATGVVDLCGPDTPSWAQPQLGELLAAAGVVPTPCLGEPHADYHEVTGSVENDEVEPGHIAIVEAPGFSLRGDQGDLFPLTRSKVKVRKLADDAETAATDAATADAAAADAAPEEVVAQEAPDEKPSAAAEGPAEPAPEDQPKRRSRGRRQASAEAPQEAPAEEGSEPAPEAPSDAVTDADEEGPQDPKPAATTDAGEAGADGDVPAEEAPKSRRRRSRKKTEDQASDGDAAQVAKETRRKDVAPSLPLVMQEAEELAGRPKADAFRDLGLNEQIIADLASIGFEKPSPIQAKAIPVALTGKDLIGQALTGTGKTAAFTLPMLQKLYSSEGHGPSVLVLCPTRELARQVHAETLKMAGKSGARAALVYGGVSLDDQVVALERNPHFVIGTPGRIIDHIRRKNLDCSRLQAVVMDEADQMLDIGFLPDITYILKHTPPARQTMLFSATMPAPIRDLAQSYMKDPETVHVMPESVTVDKVDQKYIAVDQNKKTKLLAHFIDTQKPEQLVVFCKTKHQTDRVAKVLKNKDISANAIHGDLPQSKREKTLKGFREGTLQCLIATNVAARGLDIPSVSHVVNYDIPEAPEEYVHRIGRTGRMGKEGVARTFITPEDGQFLLEIEKHIGKELEEEVIEGITASTATEVKRTIAATPTGGGPRLLKPISGGIRLGRRRR